MDRKKFPEGWNTLVDEDLGNISGGERQRLVLARALLRPTFGMLLDEAFSALDLTTRRTVEVRSSLGNLNCIVILGV